MKKDFGLNINDICRHKGNSTYGYAKIIGISYYEKTYKIAKCEWSVDKNDKFGMIKYFKLRDLKKIEE